MEDFGSLRETFHTLAELSGKEEKTSALILEKLHSFHPYKISTFENSFNIVAEYRFSDNGPVLLFRADIDALPIQETITLEYASRHKGISHKCGHDGHTVILLALAEQLYLHPFQKGSVLLFFQSAEENGKGARQLLDSGFLNSFNVDYVFALHNIPGIEKRTVLSKDNNLCRA